MSALRAWVVQRRDDGLVAGHLGATAVTTIDRAWFAALPDDAWCLVCDAGMAPIVAAITDACRALEREGALAAVSSSQAPPSIPFVHEQLLLAPDQASAILLRASLLRACLDDLQPSAFALDLALRGAERATLHRAASPLIAIDPAPAGTSHDAWYAHVASRSDVIAAAVARRGLSPAMLSRSTFLERMSIVRRREPAPPRPEIPAPRPPPRVEAAVAPPSTPRPRVSLLMLAHNAARYVEAAIASVRAQTFTDFELVVWDDGSRDDTLVRAHRAAADDRRVRVISAPHQGLIGAWNSGHSELRGEFVGLVDHDDLLLPTALAETVAILDARADVGVVYTDAIVIDADGRGLARDRRSQAPFDATRLLVEFMSFHFRLIRADALARAGGATGSEMALDHDMCMRLSEVTLFHHHPAPLYAYRVHDSMTSRASRRAQLDTCAAACERALHRRGLARDHRLVVEIRAVHELIARRPIPTLSIVSTT